MKDGDAPLMQAETAWRVPLGATPLMRFWDGECVVYNPLTGNTHLLDAMAGEMLKRIIAGAVTTQTLCAHLAACFAIADDEHTRAGVEATLAVLDELGLIEPVAP